MTFTAGRRSRASAIALAAALLGLPTTAAHAAPVVVSPGSLSIWRIVNTAATGAETAGPTPAGTRSEFADGPAPAPAGLGSLRQVLGAPEEATRLEASVLNGWRPVDVSDLSYWTYVRAGGAGVASAMQLLVDRNADGRFRLADDDLLTFEPRYQHGGAWGDAVPNQCAGVSGCVGRNLWQRWDAVVGGWWSSRDGGNPPVRTLTTYQAANPAARLATDVASLRIVAGGGGAPWLDFDGNLDRVRVLGADYDFESLARVVDCSAAGDDIAAVQSAVDSAAEGFAVRLRGVCDFSAAAPHGGDTTSIQAAAVVLRRTTPARRLVVESDGAPGSASIVGSGTQTAFFVPPGAEDVAIRGLGFSNVARPVVVASATRVTIGAGATTAPDPAGNAIAGGTGLDAAILAVATDAAITVAHGAAGAQTATYSATPALTDLVVAGNRVSYDAPGLAGADRHLVGVDVRRVGAATIDGVEIAANAVWYATNEFRSFDLNAIRVQGAAGPAGITGVRIHDNSIGRPNEVPGIVPPVAAGGRVGILVHRAEDVRVERNRIRVKLSSTPGPVPGGGIIVAETSDAAVDGNTVSVLADPGTESSDLGGVGVAGDLGVLFGTPPGGPPSTRIDVANNTIGETEAGAQRGIVVDGSTWVDVHDNTVAHSTGPALAIGATVEGPGGTRLPRAVAASVLCDNLLDGVLDDPNETRLGAAGAATASNFPGGSLTAANGECVPAGISIAETGVATEPSESGVTDTYSVSLDRRPRVTVTVGITAGTQAAVSPSSLTFTPDDWYAPQPVTVSAVQDTIPEGTHLQSLTHVASSADADYDGLSRTLLARILDDDAGSILVAESAGSTIVAEGGITDTYTIVLGSRPAADVHVRAFTDGQTYAAPGLVTFTQADWAVPRTITVSAFDDAAREGAHLGTIRHTATSGDANFNGTPIPGIVASIVDNDLPPIPIIKTPLEGAIIRVAQIVVSGTGERGDTLRLSEGAVTLGTTIVSSAGTWAIGPIAFAEGSHTITAVQTDANGFTSPPATRRFVIDLTPPEAPVIVFPTEGITLRYAHVVVEGTAEPLSTVVITEGSLARSTPVDAGGNWATGITFAAGAHTIVATVYDGGGNPGPSSAPRTFTVDADGIAPDPPTIVSPPRDGIVPFEFVASGFTEPLALVEIWEGAEPLGSGVAGSDGFFEVELNLEVSRVWNLLARARDTSFNMGRFGPPHPVIVDGVKPTCAVRRTGVSLPIGSVVPPGDEVSTKGTAKDNTGIARVEVTYTDMFGRSFTRQVTIVRPITGGVEWEDRRPLDPGVWDVLAFSFDLAGNRSNGSATTIVRL